MTLHGEVVGSMLSATYLLEARKQKASTRAKEVLYYVDA